MTLNEFISKYNGKKWDWDGVYGAQCFDLFQFYNRDMFGGGFVSGNGAVDIWSTYPANIYTKIPNSPTGYPLPGDVMIWGTNYGPWGHVAVVTKANVDNFTCLSQNDPAGRETHLKDYPNYSGVLGWLHPKVGVVVDAPVVDDCFAKLTQITAERDRLNGVIEGKDSQIADLTKQVADLKAKDANYEALVAEKNGLSVQLTEAQKQIDLYKTGYDALPQMTDERDELLRQKGVWIDAEKTYNRQLGQCKSDLAGIKSPVKQILLSILDQLKALRG